MILICSGQGVNQNATDRTVLWTEAVVKAAVAAVAKVNELLVESERERDHRQTQKEKKQEQMNDELDGDK